MHTLVPVQGLLILIVRVGLLVIVNVSPRLPGIGGLLVPAVICMLFPFLGGYVQMKYNMDKNKLSVALRDTRRNS